jgi:outer membrane protein assembly factor BamA
MWRAGCAVVIAALGATGLAAQNTGEPNPRHSWVDHLYPALWYSSIDGFWIAGHYDWSSPMGFADRPEPTFARIAFDAGASTEGSYSVIADAQAPAYWDGWRLGLTLSLSRANRLGYFGQGNNTVYDSDSTTALGRSYFYRVSRTSRSARLTIQRKIAGPLRLLVGGSLDHAAFRVLPGVSLYQRDSTGPFSDRVARAGLVLDTRDVEIDPHRGVFAEAIVGMGRGYTRTTTALHLYAHPLERLILAARAARENITGTAPLSVQQTLETSDGPVVALGGAHSLRGYYDSRFLGPGKIAYGLEARYGLLWAPRLLEVKLFAFYDAGRVFSRNETVRLTFQGLHSAMGGGVALALMRNTLVLLEAGKGSETAQVMFATTWSF